MVEDLASVAQHHGKSRDATQSIEKGKIFSTSHTGLSMCRIQAKTWDLQFAAGRNVTPVAAQADAPWESRAQLPATAAQTRWTSSWSSRCWRNSPTSACCSAVSVGMVLGR